MFFKYITLTFILLSATPVTHDSAPILPSSEPPTQENNEEQDEEEEGKDTIQTDQQEAQQELIKADTDNENQDIIEKPDRESPPRLPDNFYYEAEKIHAKPLTTNKNTFPENTLSM
jgi:hypothetical protein